MDASQSAKQASTTAHITEEGVQSSYIAPEQQLEDMAVNRPLTIAIEGIPGSGKSTLLEYFRDFPGVQVCLEPVDKWQNYHGHDLLAAVYEDRSRWGFEFQMCSILTRLQLLSREQSKDETPRVRILERSLLSNRNVYLEMARRTGVLTEHEVQLADDWHAYLSSQLGAALKVDLIVYLRVSPETAFMRTLERNRPSEAGLTQEFLQTLHETYDDWLVNHAHGKAELPEVLVLDADQSPEELRMTFANHHIHVLGKDKADQADSLLQGEDEKGEEEQELSKQAEQDDLSDLSENDSTKRMDSPSDEADTPRRPTSTPRPREPYSPHRKKSPSSGLFSPRKGAAALKDRLQKKASSASSPRKKEESQSLFGSARRSRRVFRRRWSDFSDDDDDDFGANNNDDSLQPGLNASSGRHNRSDLVGEVIGAVGKVML